jgi:cell division inhibitor SepF
MVTAGDAYDGWYEDDDRYGEPEEGRSAASHDAQRLSLVRRAGLAFEVIVPESFDVAQTVADRLREGRPVLIDFHGCDVRLAGRLTDFASGLVYAIEGTLQHIGREVVLLAPSHVDLSGDEVSGVRSRGFYNRI